VAAIGHPEQGGMWTLTTGIVSTVIANLGNVKGKKGFQTDTSINRGNSGGPMLDAAGNIIGVNTLMSRKAADGLAITGVNYAVRSDVAKRWLEQKAGLLMAYSGAAMGTVVAMNVSVKAPPSPEASRSPLPQGSPALPAPTLAQNTAAPASEALSPDLPMADRSMPAPPASMRPGAAPANPAAAAPKPPARTLAVSMKDAKHQSLTESKPFDRDALIEAQIKELEELGDEMHQDILKHRHN
jgi:serine protease Do